jgi:hypothetical protein
MTHLYSLPETSYSGRNPPVRPQHEAWPAGLLRTVGLKVIDLTRVIAVTRGLTELVVETQLATIAEFGSPQTGPNGEPNQILLLISS